MCNIVYAICILPCIIYIQTPKGYLIALNKKKEGKGRKIRKLLIYTPRIDYPKSYNIIIIN